VSRVLVLSPEPVRPCMAGMGIRAARIGALLARSGHDVLLGSPEPDPAFDPGVPSIDSQRHGFSEDSGVFDVAIVSGHAGRPLLEAGFSGALVADLYDPFLVENLSYARTLGPRVFENDRETLFRLMDRADFILAASEEQRQFYLGLLLGLGRLTPAILEGDPEARKLCDVAPFGVDDMPPGEPAPHESTGPGGYDVFFGGVYDWYDPGLVLDAWTEILAAVPEARLLFSESPNPLSTPQARLHEVTQRAGREGWLGTSVFVLPWLPHERRGGLYRSCRLAVVAQAPSLETNLSFRTRVLDFLWAGLPVVSTSGGPAARLVERSGAGRVVAPHADALAGAVVGLLTDEEARRRASFRGREAAKAFRWSRTLEPLVRFVAAPRRVPRESPALQTVSGMFRRLAKKAKP
jgi:glycosyltransferase involved in cell wall biosynthesis